MIIRKAKAEQIDFGGLKIADYTASLNEKSSFAVISVPPGGSHKLSWSKRSDKYYFVIQGKIDFVLNGKELVLSKGDLCIVKKGKKFRYKNGSTEAVIMVLVHTPDFKLDQEVFED